MLAKNLKNNIKILAAVDWNRRLFDSLIPLPDGTSYNAYLIKGTEKTVLIDAVDPAMWEQLEETLKEVENLDYIIANHAEQDHSGSIANLAIKYPQAKILCSVKCKSMLIDHLGLNENRIETVEDLSELDLGNEKLVFIYTPWVHWPETMCVFAKEARVLFSCDFFGSHLAGNEIFLSDLSKGYEAAKRYYAEIMMPFRPVVARNLAKVEAFKPEIIAPSHGPAYDNPAFIFNAYREWVDEIPKNTAVIAYVSMHHSTEKMALVLCDQLTELGIKVQLFDLAAVDLGKLAIELVDAATIILGAPAVHIGPHPLAAYAAMLTNALRPKARFVSVFGSYGWNNKLVEKTSALISDLKVEVLEPVICKGHPKAEDFKALKVLAEKIANKHSELKLK
jgi:flavorubredoxin